MAGLFFAAQCSHQLQCPADMTCRARHRPGLQLSPKDLSYTSPFLCRDPCLTDSCAWVVSDCGCCDRFQCPPVVSRLTCLRRGSPSVSDDQTHRPKSCPGPCGDPAKGRQMDAIKRARASLWTINWGRDQPDESNRTLTKPNPTRPDMPQGQTLNEEANSEPQLWITTS